MIIRTYRCNDCSETFEVTLENSSQGDPDCPFCRVELQWQPTSFNISTAKSKAMDITQQILETDYGLSDFKDHTKPGETVIKTPPAVTTADNDAMMQLAHEAQRENPHLTEEVMANRPLNPEQRKMIDGFWGNTPSGAPLGAVQSFLAGAKSGPAANAGNVTMAALSKLGQAQMITRVPRVLKPR